MAGRIWKAGRFREFLTIWQAYSTYPAIAAYNVCIKEQKKSRGFPATGCFI
jgi:hypothetical protein